MDFAESFSAPKPLRHVLAQLPNLSREAWCYLPWGTEHITLDTPCRVCEIDARDLSPEECDELDEFPKTIGLQNFLCKDQLEDILTNLGQQCSTFSDEELEAALNHYWARDAFIDLSDRDA